MIRKLVLAAFIALVAAPAFTLGMPGLSASHGLFGGIRDARVVDVGSLLSTGLI